jgi:hypothetical protein
MMLKDLLKEQKYPTAGLDMERPQPEIGLVIAYPYLAPRPIHAAQNHRHR